MSAEYFAERFRIESDSVRLFLEDEKYKSHPKKYETLKFLYEKYRSYCHDEGCRPTKKQNFKKRLESAGLIIERKNVGLVVYVKQEKEREDLILGPEVKNS